MLNASVRTSAVKRMPQRHFHSIAGRGRIVIDKKYTTPSHSFLAPSLTLLATSFWLLLWSLHVFG